MDRIINDIQISNKLMPFTYDDIKGALLPETSESRITEALRIMVGEGILRVKSRLSVRPKRYLNGKDGELAKGEQKGRKPANFQIILNQSAFEKIFHIYLNDDIKKFLTSRYTNKMIKESGFSTVYDVIKPHLERREFRKIATNSLLDQSSTVIEYNELGEILRREIPKAYNYESSNNSELEKESIELSSFLVELGQELSSTPIKPIEILSELDPLQAVRFYRKNLHKCILKAYNDLAERNVITKGLCNFLTHDNYLSPLTAHPLNSFTKILFSNPFERIYEDAFLLDGEAFGVLSGRAASIYYSFSDFLFEYFKINPTTPEGMEIISKEMIHSWNIASTRFDIICRYLNELYEEKTGSGNYHLRRSGFGYDIIDLQSGKPLLPPDISSILLFFGSIPRIFEQNQQNDRQLKVDVMAEPFSYLRPCLTFEDMGWRTEFILFEEVLSGLEEKLNL